MVDIIRRPARAAVFGSKTETAPTPTAPASPPASVTAPAAIFAEACPRPLLVVDAARKIRYANPALRHALNAPVDPGGTSLSDWSRAMPRVLDTWAGENERRIVTDLSGHEMGATVIHVAESENARWLLIFEGKDGAWSHEARPRMMAVMSDARQMSNLGSDLANSASEISGAVHRVAEGAQDQAIRVEETVRAVKVLADEINSISESIDRARSASAGATLSAERGQEAARLAIEKMNTLRTTVDDSGRIVKRLGERSNQISNIVGTITSVNQQANLLSLNAAIEAARAGEHGRGFAVVADEMRKLAESTRRAAEQIVSLTTEINTEIDAVVQTMQKGTSDVAATSTTVSESLHSLADIVAAINATSETVDEMYRATNTQREGAETIVKAVDAVAVIAEETSSATEATSLAIEELRNRMGDLSTISQRVSKSSEDLAKILGVTAPIGEDKA